MIISASRRTDIPSFYGQWFINRLKAGEVYVRNPLNRKQVSVIPLGKDNVDCFVFWTKDPGPFLPFLDELDSFGIPYYFTITITPYGPEIEKKIRSRESIVESVRLLADRIGSERIIWRYDPILFNEQMDSAYHLESFRDMAEQLEGSTEKCVFSFLTEYGKIGGFLKEIGVLRENTGERRRLIGELVKIADHKRMLLASCALEDDFSDMGVEHNRCIDPVLIEKICGYKIKSRKDKSQREACRCMESRDIGAYNTCLHGCRYCYANRNSESIKRKTKLYDPDSPMLCDFLDGDETLSSAGNCNLLKSEDLQSGLFEY